MNHSLSRLGSLLDNHFPALNALTPLIRVRIACSEESLLHERQKKAANDDKSGDHHDGDHLLVFSRERFLGFATIRLV
jgi:hypothetical protein